MNKIRNIIRKNVRDLRENSILMAGGEPPEVRLTGFLNCVLFFGGKMMRTKKETRILSFLIAGILAISTSLMPAWAAGAAEGDPTVEALQAIATDAGGTPQAIAAVTEAGETRQTPIIAAVAGDASRPALTAAADEAAAEAGAADTSDDSPEGATSAPAASAAATGFHYEHDPMENPAAARDIFVNPDAIYGYSPNPDSVRLGAYASYDWTDAAAVAKGRKQREEYHVSISELYRMIEEMLHEGKNVEEIARAVSRRRNELRLEAYGDDTKNLMRAKKSNLETYGHENGPTADSLYKKYGSWQTVLEKALSSNPGMDACLGLYDEYYDTYDYVEQAKANSADADSSDAADSADADSSDAADSANADSAAETAAESASGAKTYKVVSGDSLWKIAEKHYGDGGKWNLIYEKNKDTIPNPSLIFPGQELTIPDAA